MNSDKSNDFQNQLHGHVEFLSHFCKAKVANNLHHAYLLYGSVGIGKSLLARQLAAYLLENDTKHNLLENANKVSEVEFVLSLNHNNPVWRQVFYHSHPDMIYLSANKSEQNKSGQIKIDDIKSIMGVTNHQSGRGGWRIIIIDSIDETNRNGANAILKILEEPPNKTIFFLVSHNISNVIPTILSRCQKVKLSPLTNKETRLVLEQHIQDLSDAQLEQLVILCEGSPGMAISIHESGVDSYLEELNQILKKGKSGLENILKLGIKWGNNISKKPELYSSTSFIFDKLFSESALLAIKNSSYSSFHTVPTSTNMSKMVFFLSQNYTAEELTNLHLDWQKEFRTAQTNYLDMSVFMQQTFYKMYSQIHIR